MNVKLGNISAINMKFLTNAVSKNLAFSLLVSIFKVCYGNSLMESDISYTKYFLACPFGYLPFFDMQLLVLVSYADCSA